MGLTDRTGWTTGTSQIQHIYALKDRFHLFLQTFFGIQTLVSKVKLKKKLRPYYICIVNNNIEEIFSHWSFVICSASLYLSSFPIYVLIIKIVYYMLCNALHFKSEQKHT